MAYDSLVGGRGDTGGRINTVNHRGLTMVTLSDFDLGIELFEFEFGRANTAAHDKLSNTLQI